MKFFDDGANKTLAKKFTKKTHLTTRWNFDFSRMMLLQLLLRNIKSNCCGDGEIAICRFHKRTGRRGRRRR